MTRSVRVNEASFGTTPKEAPASISVAVNTGSSATRSICSATSLARYRIWDGIRGLDYLTSRPEVDPKRIGCVGNSGGGTLTAYIAALDPRVSVAAIGCFITTLRLRMGSRIQQDPDADPEQDLFGFLSEGIDHAGLLAMIAPRPTLLATARLDFFPDRRSA